MTRIDHISFDDDEEGLPQFKIEHYDERGVPRPGIVLEASGYRRGKHINGLGGIDFYAADNDWVRGVFHRISEIPERCSHLREIARDMGLPE